MSIWDLAVGACAPEPEIIINEEPVSLIEKADRDSCRPFEAECIGSIVTYRGLRHDFTKPTGYYKHIDRNACRDAGARIRQRKAEQFKRLLAEITPVPTSGVRGIIKNISKKLKGVGT